MALSLVLPLALLLATPAGAAHAGPGDEDARDRVVLRSGKELAGRVLTPYAEELDVRVGGRTVQVSRSDVRELSTVTTRMARWLELRRPEHGADQAWALVGLADAAELPALARLQAYHVLTVEPEHVAAHEYLGHRGEPGGWRWTWERKHLDADDWDERARDRTSPLVLRSEHWRVTCDAGLAPSLACLFDLERLYVAFGETFGRATNAREVLEPLELSVYASRERQPVHSTILGHPYYDPGWLLGSVRGTSPHAVTSFEPQAGRPVRLLDLATQQLLYESVLGDRLSGTPRDTVLYRECATLELGLAHWLEGRLGGPPGFARAVPFVLDPEQRFLARALLDHPVDGSSPLSRLVLASYERYQLDPRANEETWAQARALAAFLMDPATRVPSGRSGIEAVEDLLRAIYVEGRGNSSTLWDEVLGGAVESLEGPWREWL